MPACWRSAPSRRVRVIYGACTFRAVARRPTRAASPRRNASKTVLENAFDFRGCRRLNGPPHVNTLATSKMLSRGQEVAVDLGGRARCSPEFFVRCSSLRQPRLAQSGDEGFKDMRLLDEELIPRLQAGNAGIGVDGEQPFRPFASLLQLPEKA